MLRWELKNVAAAYLYEGKGRGWPITDFFGTQDACPKETTVYTLQVQILDGGEELRRVTISVMPPSTPIPDTSTPIPDTPTPAPPPSTPTPGLG
jgi:hypothetical protein